MCKCELKSAAQFDPPPIIEGPATPIVERVKFVRCPEVYLNIYSILDLQGTLEGLFSARVRQNQPLRVHFRVHLGVHEGVGGIPGSYYCAKISINEFF